MSSIFLKDIKFGAGQSVKRQEDRRLLTGKGNFVDDKNVERGAWLYLLRSPHAHARVVSIDTTPAAKMSGVLAIYTGADLIEDGVNAMGKPTAPFKRPDGSPITVPPRRLLAHEIVRFTGEPVAGVVAKTREEAQQAAEAIIVEYEERPAVIGTMDAIKPRAPVVWDEAPDNIVAVSQYGDAAVVEAAFARAAHVVSLDVVNQRIAPAAMEPRAAVAHVASGKITLEVQSQTPTRTRDYLAALFNHDKEKVRILVGDIGGGFGQKTGVYPEDSLAAYAAMKLKRPVRWRGERIDEFLGGTHGRDLVSTAELALDAGGRVLGYRVRSVGATGAYLTNEAVVVPLLLGPFVGTGIYDLKCIHFDLKAVMTHTAPMGAYRGAGRPEAVFIIERLMDEAARQLDIDPRKLRKLNSIKPDQFPYKTATGQTYDVGAFAEMIDRVSELSDWDGFNKRRREAKARGKLYGRGLASYIEWTGGRTPTEKASLFATPEGRVVLLSATQAMGQGIATSYAQMIAAALGVPIEQIDIVQGDTDQANGFGSVASRSLFMGGSAAVVAAGNLITKARERAATRFETAIEDIDYRNGRLTVAGTDRSATLFELAAASEGARLSVDGVGEVDGPTWPNGAHVCEVEIDPDTGETRVVRYTTSDDVGVAINPMIVEGQMHGGIVQGLGQALCEGIAYGDDGQLLTATFQDYCIPRASDVPPLHTTLDPSTPCRNNALGAKGCGESGALGAPPCIANAVMDALSTIGVGSLQTPLTPFRIWQAIQSARS